MISPASRNHSLGGEIDFNHPLLEYAGASIRTEADGRAPSGLEIPQVFKNIDKFVPAEVATGAMQRLSEDLRGAKSRELSLEV